MSAAAAELVEVVQASAAGYHCGGQYYLMKCQPWVAPACGLGLLSCLWTAILPKAGTLCRRPPHRAAWQSRCGRFGKEPPQRRLSLSGWCGSEDQMVVSPISWTVSAVHGEVDHRGPSPHGHLDCPCHCCNLANAIP